MFRPEPKLIIDNDTVDNVIISNIQMEDLIEKLKLMNYEREFLKELKMKPFNRHYFILPTNPGEQFYMFCSLASWLIRKTGKTFEQPQEYDDPNSTITSILDGLRQIGVSVDFPPSRLKQGVGPHAVLVLDKLADQALRISNFLWKKPEIQTDPDLEPETIEDDSEIILDRVEEEMATAYSDSDDDQLVLDLGKPNSTTPDQLKHSLKKQKSTELVNGNSEDAQNLVNSMDTEAWRLELERVLPQLKVVIKADPRDWRFRLEQMKNYRDEIKDMLGHTKEHLNKLHTDISVTMEKIGSREKYLNSNLQVLVDEYKQLFNGLSALNSQMKEKNQQVQEQTSKLAQVSAELEEVKLKMEQRGTSMSDNTPVVNIKKAIATMTEDITMMEIEIGLMQHALMNSNDQEKGGYVAPQNDIKFSSSIYVK